MQFNTSEVVASLQAIPSGRAGVRETLRQMSAVAVQGKKTVPVRVTALNIVQGLPSKAWAAEVKAIYDWVRDNIRFVRDVRGVETIQTPDKTLDFGQGDCDDQSVLIASLLESIGHPTRFMAVGTKIPGTFEHVYTETKIGPNWIPLETTEESAYIGWQPPNIVARMPHHN